MPSVHYSIAELQETLKPLRHKQSIALVPTMGNLHQGHLELVRLARQHADIVVVSLFVNPTQFGVGEDFDSYPRTLDEDVAKLASVGVDYVFAPSISEMYPVLPPPTLVMAGAIATQLCGRSRPTHFDGVGIVVAKLFNIIQPDSAIFGQKDYQQLAIIKQLVRDLSYPIEIIGAPIVRAEDGLALSSRNQYLTANERMIAPLLHKELQLLAQQLIKAKAEQPIFEALMTETTKRLTHIGFDIDYLEIKTAELTPLDYVNLVSESSNIHGHSLVILIAARLGRARLLDNQQLTINSSV